MTTGPKNYGAGTDASIPKTDPAVGTPLYDWNGRYLGRIGYKLESKRGAFGIRLPRSRLGLIADDGSWSPLRAGDYLTAVGPGANLAGIRVNASGEITSKADLSAAELERLGFLPETGGGGGGFSGGDGGFSGRPTAEMMALAQQAADLEIMINDADRKGDTEMQLFLLRERAKIDADEELVRQQFQEKMAAEERQNARRMQAVSEAGQLTRQAIDIRQRARETLANLAGQDPLRAAIGLSGGVMAGRSPAQGMRSELTSAAYAPLPQIDAQNAPLDQVEAAISNLRNKPAQLPAAPAVVGAPGATALGLAGGGEVQIEQDALTPNTSGPTGVGIMVGEKGPELIEVTDKGFRVIPILKRAAGGLAVTGGAFSSSLDRAPMSSALATSAAAPVRTVQRPSGLATLDAGAPAPAPTVPRAPAAPQSAALATMAPAAATPRPPTGLATELPTMLAATPAQKTFLDDLGSGRSITSRDALLAQQLGLYDLANVILAYTAGTATLEQVKAAIAAAYGVTEPPPPVEPPGPAPSPAGSEVQFLDNLARAWPTITQRDATQLAVEADRFGLAEIKQILLTYAASDGGEEAKNAAYLQLLALLPGLRPGEIPTDDQGRPLYDVGSMRQAIQALWTELGIPQIPTTETGALGSPQFINVLQQAGYPAETLRAFGISPRLFRLADTGQVFIVSEDGKAHAITSPGLVGAQELANVLQVSPGDIMEVTAAEFAQFTSGISDPWPVVGGADAGSNLRDRVLPLLGQFLVNPNQPNRPFPLLATPMVEPATGLMLPLPRMVASILPRLNPATQALIYQAYQAAGVYSTASVERERLFYTPTGKYSAASGSFLG